MHRRLVRLDTAILAMVVQAACGDGSAAAQCIDYGDYLHWEGGVDTPGGGQGVAVAGSHAYVADGSSGLQVVDITTPGSPVIVGSVDTRSARGVAVAGSYAYVADGYAGVQVVDISAPGSPVIVGGINMQDIAYGVVVAGSHAYVACGLAGLQVLPAQCGGTVAVEHAVPPVRTTLDASALTETRKMRLLR